MTDVRGVVTDIAEKLESIDAPALPERYTHPHSLADGATGTSVLFSTLSSTDPKWWAITRACLSEAATTPVTLDASSSMFYGAGALAFAVHTAGQATSASSPLLERFDAHVQRLIHARLRQARHRIEEGVLPLMAEYDLISGLTGLGGYLLARQPRNDTTTQLLSYLVGLVEPVQHGNRAYPGWWCRTGPNPSAQAGYTDGHGNLGLAHGIAGPIALLSIAARQGVVVDGQHAAITRMCEWVNRFRMDGPTGSWWPPVVTSQQHHGEPVNGSQARPSWCYGAPGIGRALQLAGLATNDDNLIRVGVTAIETSLQPQNIDMLRGPGLCHGYAGALQAAWRADQDTPSSHLRTKINELADRLCAQWSSCDHQRLDPGLLEGWAGTALAIHSLTRPPESITWDRCLLLA